MKSEDPAFAREQPRVWGVRELINYLSRSVQRDERLANLGVRGEVTGYKQPRYGYAFFELKEPSGAVLACFIGSAALANVPPLRNGAEVIAFGNVAVHRDRSVFQLYVSDVVESGAGKDAAKYERIKRRLVEAGLFDPSRKRPIPRYPFRVGLVSSSTAEGANDFMKVARQAPMILVRTFHTIMQGPAAAESIADAISRAARWKPDVVVVVRGGGSDEDRLPFNEEGVARAIAASPIPVVTGIGHFGDHHIADDVADASMGTPSEAAKNLVAPFLRVREFLRDAERTIDAATHRRLDAQRTRLRHLAESTQLARFDRVAAALAQRVDGLADAVESRYRIGLHRRAERLQLLDRRLAAFDPAALLASRRARLGALSRALGTAWAASQALRYRDLAEGARALTGAAAVDGRRRESRLAVLSTQLRGKDPVAILQQGYAIVRHNGRAIRDAASVRRGERIEAQLSHGSLRAQVEESIDDG